MYSMRGSHPAKDSGDAERAVPHSEYPHDPTCLLSASRNRVIPPLCPSRAADTPLYSLQCAPTGRLPPLPGKGCRRRQPAYRVRSALTPLKLPHLIMSAPITLLSGNESAETPQLHAPPAIAPRTSAAAGTARPTAGRVPQPSDTAIPSNRHTVKGNAAGRFFYCKLRPTPLRSHISVSAKFPDSMHRGTILEKNILCNT